MGVSKRIYTAHTMGQDVNRLFEPKAPKPKKPKSKKRKTKKKKEKPKWPPEGMGLPSIAELEALSQSELFQRH